MHDDSIVITAAVVVVVVSATEGDDDDDDDEAVVKSNGIQWHVDCIRKHSESRECVYIFNIKTTIVYVCDASMSVSVYDGRVRVVLVHGMKAIAEFRQHKSSGAKCEPSAPFSKCDNFLALRVTQSTFFGRQTTRCWRQNGKNTLHIDNRWASTRYIDEINAKKTRKRQWQIQLESIDTHSETVKKEYKLLLSSAGCSGAVATHVCRMTIRIPSFSPLSLTLSLVFMTKLGLLLVYSIRMSLSYTLTHRIDKSYVQVRAVPSAVSTSIQTAPKHVPINLFTSPKNSQTDTLRTEDIHRTSSRWVVHRNYRKIYPRNSNEYEPFIN